LVRMVEDGREVTQKMANPDSMQQLADRFINDAEFREQMRQDPEGAAQREGYQLDEEDRQSLRSMDWSGSDQQLDARVSKYVTKWC
jgi:hypothetical protein